MFLKTEEVWDVYEVTLLAKFYGAVRVQDFRPIAVWSVPLKLYSSMLGELCGLQNFRISRYQIAFRRGFQTHEVVSSMRPLAEKAVEFDDPLFIFDGDLHKAYDKVKHVDWIRCHERRHIPKIITAAWVREVRRGKAQFKLPGLPSSPAVSRERSMVQGDPEAPKNFNLFLDDAILEFESRCMKEEWGYPLDLRAELSPGEPPTKKCKTNRNLLPILVYAGNYLIFATSLRMLRAMVETWHRIIFGRYSCEVILADCKWITTLPDTYNMGLSIEETSIPRVGWAVGLKVLGANVTLDNCSSKAISLCIQTGWIAFKKHSSILCGKRAAKISHTSSGRS